jgi:long-chain acyl-CoA synthetase
VGDFYCNFKGFGMTESSPVTHFQPDEGAILGGCGVPIPNTIAKIVDIDTGKALGPNEVGFSSIWN